MSFRTIVFGNAMMSFVRLLRLLGQCAIIPVLARLLTPAEYGLAAIALPFALLAMMIADAGTGISLVRTPPSDRITWSSRFWFTVLLGTILAGIMIVLSPFVAIIFHEPALQPMIIALALIVFAQALHLVPAAALQHAQRLRSIAVADVLAIAAGIVTALYMAYHACGAWSLIGQQIAFFAVRVLLICALSPFRARFVFNWRAVKHALIGRTIFSTSIVTYLSRASSIWLIGNFLGASLLGFYFMAFQFARLPMLVVSGPLHDVLHSQLARLKDDKPTIARGFLLATRLLAAIIFPLMGMLAVAHGPVFAILLSGKWQYAGVLFMLLAPACAMQAVTGIGKTVVTSVGRADIQLRSSVEYMLLLVIALRIAVPHGLVAAAATYSAVTILYQLRYLALILPVIGHRLGDYFETFLIPLIATGLGICAYQATVASEAMENWIALMLAAIIGLAVLLFTLLFQKRALIDQLRNWGNETATHSDENNATSEQGID